MRKFCIAALCLLFAGCAQATPQKRVAEQRNVVEVASQIISAEAEHFSRYRTHTRRELDLIALDPGLATAFERYDIRVHLALEGDAYLLRISNWGTGKFIALRDADGQLHLTCKRASSVCANGRWELPASADAGQR
jgi:hypothetical protein